MNQPVNADECMAAPASYTEVCFDLDPKVGCNHRKRDQYLHSSGMVHRCGVCNSAPISALSDYGYTDFTYCDEDDGEPEWVGLCWECARPIVYGEELQGRYY